MSTAREEGVPQEWSTQTPASLAHQGITIWQDDLQSGQPQQNINNSQWNSIRGEDEEVYSINRRGRNVWQRPFEYKTLEQKVMEARRKVTNEPFETNDYTYVRTRAQVRAMVSSLADLPLNYPWISFDLEANNLGHKAYPALMQIRDHRNLVTYLVDTLVLQRGAWVQSGRGIHRGTTLKSIFEDPHRIKLIWDCRADSCCLYGQLGIRLRGVLDVQYLHMLLMNKAPPVRKGLVSGVEDMTNISDEALAVWKQNKALGGHEWMKRPFSDEEKRYATGDVLYLHLMWQHAKAYLTPRERSEYTSIGAGTPESFADCWEPSRYGPIRQWGAPFLAGPIRRPAQRRLVTAEQYDEMLGL